MKNFITVFGGTIIMVIMFIACITIYTKDTKTKEIQTALSESMEETLNEMIKSNVEIQSEKDMSDYFVSGIAKRVNSISSLKVNIYTADFENGMIDAEVTAYFNYMIGSGSTTVRRTLYIDNYGVKQTPNIDKSED